MDLVVEVLVAESFIRRSWGWVPNCQGCHSWGSYNAVLIVEVLKVDVLKVDVLIFEVL